MTASTAPSRTTRPRTGLGLSACGLGVAALLVGVFAAGAWFVVVPVALLAVIFGLFGISQVRHIAPIDVTAAVVGLLTGAAAVTLGGAATNTFLTSLHQSPAAARSSAYELPWNSDDTLTWDRPHDFGNNVAVAISAPVTYLPAADGTRSVVLNVTITNCGHTPYHPDPTVYTPNATFDGQTLHQITVPVHKVTTIQPGRSFDYRVAYALPTRRGELNVTLRQNLVIGGQA